MARVITIDGPAGAGKTTAAQGVAQRLGFQHINTGVAYRALAVWHRRNPNCPFDTNDIVAELRPNGDGTYAQIVTSSGVCLNPYLYAGASGSEDNVSELSSRISERRDVRRAANRIIRDMCGSYNIAIEGRDTGSVLFPDADLKIYLTADLEIRAGRLRPAEAGDRPLADRMKDLSERDYRDAHREHDPLVRTDDMIVVDNTHLDAEQTVSRICAIWDERFPKKGGSAHAR